MDYKWQTLWNFKAFSESCYFSVQDGETAEPPQIPTYSPQPLPTHVPVLDKEEVPRVVECWV